MSRTTPPGRKLAIKKETLRRLDPNQLARVVGGIGGTTDACHGQRNDPASFTEAATTTNYCVSGDG
jgi:hypothetical protein